MTADTKRRVPASSEPPIDATSAPAGQGRIIARRGNRLLFLQFDEVWAFEAHSGTTLVHGPRGSFELDLSLSEMEGRFGSLLLRAHRSWLVNVACVRELNRSLTSTILFVGCYRGSDRLGIEVPVARECAAAVRAVLLEGAIGLRARDRFAEEDAASVHPFLP
jgi:two-component system, LytTR family, response regulator LytT